MKTRILSILLILALLFSSAMIFTACSPEEPNTDDTQGNTQDTTDTADSTDDSESESGSDSESESESESDSESESESESEDVYLEPDPEVIFISYNIVYYSENDDQMDIRYEGQSRADYSMEKRAPRLESLLKHYQPDVIALQEVNRLWWPYLVSNEDSIINTLGYEWAGNQGALKSKNGKSNFDNDLYNLLLWDPAKFEEIDSGVFRLNSSFYGEANKDRQCTWAILKNKTTGVETLFASTHLCTQASSALKDLGLAQSEALTKKLIEKAEGRTIIVGGDFNGDTGSSAYNHITRVAGFSNTRFVATKNTTPTMSSMRSWGKTNKWQTANNAIDHVFFLGNTYATREYKVLHDTFDANNVICQEMSKVGINYDLSDHLGIYVRFVERGHQ